MSFPFPPNPVDGQQVSSAMPDGSVATAIYNAAKNEWVVTRNRPQSVVVTGTPQINVTATADRQVITWDANLGTWVASTVHPPKLQELADVVQSDSPHLGTMPIWTYASGQTAKDGRFGYATPAAHLKNWESVVHWESGATVFHRGHLWRATQDNTAVEPQIESGKVMLFIHQDHEPSFGIVPAAVDAAAPVAGLHPAGVMRYAYWLQYIDDTHMALWKFVLKGTDPATHKPIGEWEGRPWPCLAWRHPVAPPAHFPSGVVMVWINDQEGGIAQPIVGQQKWALLDLTISIGMAADVDAPYPKHHDILVYDGTEKKWINMPRADLATALLTLTTPQITQMIQHQIVDALAHP